MDYIVGSVAALISGNVTPNRPKVLKRALTPMKHQPSPNVTPKSESVTDRSIFLSPTMQKKKAIVKKSPKRIFQNPDMDITSENDCSSTTSPRADKVKKHLKDELDVDIDNTRYILSPKSPKKKMKQGLTSPSKEKLNYSADSVPEEIEVNNENTPKKKKKKQSFISELTRDGILDNIQNKDSHIEIKPDMVKTTHKKKKKPSIFTIESIDHSEQSISTVSESTLEKDEKITKKIKKNSNEKTTSTSQSSTSHMDTLVDKDNEGHVKHKKNKKYKKSTSKNILNLVKHKADEIIGKDINVNEVETDNINPNAITNQDTDSEHDSDDDIQSENEESNKSVLDTGPQESSEDEEDKVDDTKNSSKGDIDEHVRTEEEIRRTLFVGNVPFSNKCKKEIKRIFSKYGEIETVRIRTVPVKDGRVTPKLAVIKNELHPERSTVNVYIKYAHPSSVNDALVENNTVLKEHHLRVARSDVTGSEHDPRRSVFVGNLPFALEDEALRAAFDRCGEIESVRIVRDRKTNAGKGFGYVNFASKDGVELALALTEEDLTLKNRILRVKRCTQPTANEQRNDRGRQPGGRGKRDNRDKQGNRGNRYNPRGGINNKDTQVNRFGRNQFDDDRLQRGYRSTDGKGEGAYRRIMMKRKPQENSDGPPQKRQTNVNQSNKEKKPKKEFVGITADKKKFQKRKLNKDQRKKRALGEILSKQRR